MAPDSPANHCKILGLDNKHEKHVIMVNGLGANDIPHMFTIPGLQGSTPMGMSVPTGMAVGSPMSMGISTWIPMSSLQPGLTTASSQGTTPVISQPIRPTRAVE